MNRFLNYVLLIACLLFNESAESCTADLELQVVTSNYSGLNEGDVGTVEFILINNGPDSAGLGSPVSGPISVDSEITYFDGSNRVGFSANNTMPQDCFFVTTVVEPRPGNLPGFFHSLHFEVLASGDSVSCVVNFQITGELNFQEVVWDVLNPLDMDPDISNNSTSIVFRGATVQVPFLSNLGVAVLLLIMFLITRKRFNTYS